MKVEPVKSIGQPKYPDAYADEVKQALISCKPCRWTGKPLTVGLLSAAMAAGLTFTGCSEKIPATMAENDYVLTGAPIPIEAPSEIDKNGTSDGDDIIGEVDGTEHIILGEPIPIPWFDGMIPLFEYGEGTGAIGCLAIAAPSFMTEEEAFAILASALAEAGFVLEKGDYPLTDVHIPVPFVEILPTREGEHEIKYTIGELSADRLMFSDLSLPVLFVSRKDLTDWQWIPETDELVTSSSVVTYNVKETAMALVEKNPSLAVFYDPVALPDWKSLMAFERMDGESDEDYYKRYEEAREEIEKVAFEESKKLLKAQADAFVEWFRSELVR